MTTIPLRSQTVKNYMGNQGFNECREISRIHVTGTRNGMFNVKARIPGSTTSSSYYEVQVIISPQCQIVNSNCTCPVGYRCKHINKVLLRIRNSRNSPIPSPSREHREEQRRIRNQQIQIARGACVYIAYACKSEPEGSDYRYQSTKDKFDEETLGVFFSQRQANMCARNYVINELELMDDDDFDDDDMDDYNFEYDGQEYEEEPCSYGYYHKVWVECKAIEDASPNFRP